MSSTRIGRHIKASRAIVYRELLDARAGGLFRISLTYAEPTGTGKTTAHTDTCHGHFVKLVPNE